MKKIFIGSIGLLAIILITLVACDKNEIATPKSNTEILSKKGGNGKGPNSGGGGTATSNDSLLAACGILFTDSGQFYPTVQVNNYRWSKRTGYSYDQSTGGYTYPYDILVIDFDPVTIPGKTVNCYMLFADQCDGRVVCNKMNGLAVSQVITCNSTNQFFLPIGLTWLNPYVQTYTGYIYVGTTDGCIHLSQRITFEPPRILQL